MSNRTEWDDIPIRAHQRDGSIIMERKGSGPLRIGSAVKPLPDAEPKLSLNASSVDDDNTLKSVSVTLHISPETAREMGEWLIEHADDEPEDVMGGDGDE